jgi:hypothetical protein
MATYTSKQWILANKPAGMPVFSGQDATFKLQTVTLPELKEGEMVSSWTSFVFTLDGPNKAYYRCGKADLVLYLLDLQGTRLFERCWPARVYPKHGFRRAPLRSTRSRGHSVSRPAVSLRFSRCVSTTNDGPYLHSLECARGLSPRC